MTPNISRGKIFDHHNSFTVISFFAECANLLRVFPNNLFRDRKNHVTVNLVPERTDLESTHQMFRIIQTCILLAIVALVIYIHTKSVRTIVASRTIAASPQVASWTCSEDVRTFRAAMIERPTLWKKSNQNQKIVFSVARVSLNSMMVSQYASREYPL